MTGALIQWLRQHFASATNLEDPGLALENTEFVWSSGPDTRLAIESVTKWNPQLVESRPALIIKRNKMTWRRIAIDNRKHGYVDKKGRKSYAGLWIGSHTVFCISREGAECEKLGTEVYRELSQFAPAMRPVLCLMKLELEEYGEIGLLEEATEHFAVPVTIGYVFQDVWETRPLTAPPLTKTDMTIRSR